MLQIAGWALAIGGAAYDEYIVSRSGKFDLLDGEIEIMKDRVEWRKGRGVSWRAWSVDGILCLTNKRLRFQRVGSLGAESFYLSYPLSAIVSVKLSPELLDTGFELEFSDGRNELLIASSQRDDWVAKILEAKNSIEGTDAIERAQDGTVLDADKTTLRRNITNCFNESELRTLCFDLSIDYESIPGSTKEEKARELIVYCEHHGLLIRLLKMCQQQRPHVKWI